MRKTANDKKPRTLESVGDTIDKLVVKVDGLTDRVDDLARKLESLAAIVDSLATTVDDLARMVANNFCELEARIEGLDEKINLRLDTLSNRLDHFVYNYATRVEHKKLEERLALLERRR